MTRALKRVAPPFTLIALSTALLSACASGPSVEPQPEQLNPGRFAYAVIEPVELRLPPGESLYPDQGQTAEQTRAAFVEELTQTVGDQFKENGLTVIQQEDLAGKEGRTVIVRTQINLDPGSRALRWAIGMVTGLGKAHAQGSSEAISPVTGKVIARFSHEDSMRMGFLGGDARNTAREVAEDTAEDLSDKLASIPDTE